VNTYYPYVIHDHARDIIVLWSGGEQGAPDRLTLTPDGQIATYPDLRGLRQFTQANHLVLDADEPPVLDLDAVAAWLAHPSNAPIECDLLLSAWNFFTDVSNSVGAPLDDRDNAKDRIYDKLFWGNNLPAMTPPGEHYTPAWSTQERTTLARVISHGLSLWQRYHQQP
jgi:hypothetical protein